MRSEYTQNQLLEQKSIHYILGKCIRLNWKYRQYDQDNDVDGEIELFEKEENLIKQITKSKYIKVQLKATNKIEKNEHVVKFQLEKKFLEFIEECDIPLLLILYDNHEDTGYWLFLQRYLHENLSNNNNKPKKKTIEIPLKNNLENIEYFKNEILKIATNGMLEILLGNKKIDLKDCYDVIETEDISYPGKARKLVRVYINNLFLKNEFILQKLLERIEENYIKNYIKDTYIKEKVDELTIFIYDSLLKIGKSSALFRYEIKIENGEYRKELTKISSIDYPIEEDSKGGYLQFIFLLILETQKISIFLYNSIDLRNEIIKHIKTIEQLESNFNNYTKHCPLECNELDSTYSEWICLLDNLKYEIKSNESILKKRVSNIKKMEIKIINLVKNKISTIFI